MKLKEFLLSLLSIYVLGAGPILAEMPLGFSSSANVERPVGSWPSPLMPVMDVSAEVFSCAPGSYDTTPRVRGWTAMTPPGIAAQASLPGFALLAFVQAGTLKPDTQTATSPAFINGFLSLPIASRPGDQMDSTVRFG